MFASAGSTTTPETATCQCEVAAKWAALTYEVSGVEAAMEPLEPSEGSTNGECAGWAVLVPSLHRIECVFDPGTDLGWATNKLAELSEAGWHAWALVPLSHLAGAHKVFQSSAEYVQGWWESDERYVFTQPEVP